MGNTQSTKPYRDTLIEVAPGFWNVRSSFKLKGIVDIGTHMSFIRLSNGNYLVIDTVPLNDSLRHEIDQLTEGGTKMEAVVATHPFHTLAFPGFYAAYPNVPYYGCPRHGRRLEGIPWAGDLSNEEVRKKWEPEVQMRIPAGCEFVAPQPESYNHFVCVWVYAVAARTVHVDDTVNYFSHPGTLMKIAGKKPGLMEFHPSMSGPGLYPTPEAPRQFQAWVEEILRDWDFDNLCTAHIGNKLGGAKELLRQTLEEAQPTFAQLEKHNRKKQENRIEDEKVKDCSKYNVDGSECG